MGSGEVQGRCATEDGEVEARGCRKPRGTVARIHGAVADDRDGCRKLWRRDGNAGFDGGVEVALAAGEVDGIQP
jgi:hypothetical protein